ncbi:hypothetical protein ACTOB_004499 [Actinoplanes oblitus]|uniref:DUF4440 domain-containing protein n=1 Tax=Actinoplanes oblitus TaxID=3040509 RepID=A0ABY8W6H0_9ACTN|nr:hypothetical protein [Actinoplanes oblitus]WIM92555.1 hypothetical protein ACTOB_004499 [Actinoplanes oblitus]
MTFDADRLVRAFDEAELHADTATLRSLLADDFQRSRSAWQGQPMELTVRASQTWVRHGGDWRLAGLQFSPLAEG